MRAILPIGLLGLACAGSLAAFSAPVHSAQPVAEERNVIELQAEAQREVANDLLNAVLYVEASDADAARLASQLNRASGDALKLAADFKAVRARSGASQTYPVYDRNQKLTGWRGRSEIRLESRDFEAAARLIARLQAGMQLASVSFSVSPQLRKDTENEIIAEAIQAFRARAEIVRQALGGQRHVLQRVQIGTAGAAPPPRPMMRALAQSASAEVVAPQFEGGVSTITVSVSGVVRIE